MLNNPTPESLQLKGLEDELFRAAGGLRDSENAGMIYIGEVMKIIREHIQKPLPNEHRGEAATDTGNAKEMTLEEAAKLAEYRRKEVLANPELLTPLNLNLEQELKNPEFKNAYIDAASGLQVATSIRDLRGKLSQEGFAGLCGLTQSMVARLENEDYGGWSYKTLLNIARVNNRKLEIKFTELLAAQPDYKEVAEKLAEALRTCKESDAAEYSGYALIRDYNEDMVEQALAAYQGLTTKETHE